MQFNYVAYTLAQGVVKGRVDAENEYEAREEVVRQGYRLLQIKPVRKLPAIEDMFPSLFKVGTGDLVRLSRQLATMVLGGSSLQRSLEMLENESKNRVLRKILTSIRKTLDEGGTLSAGMAKYPAVFNASFVSVVEVGEHTGGLAPALEQLSASMEREHETVQRFKRTMMMPLFTMGASVGMLILMMTVMLPPLLKSFENFDADTPLITAIAMAVVGFTSDNLLIIFVAIVLFVLIYWIARRIPSVQYRMHYAQTQAPIVGSLVVARELAQFSRTNSMLLQAGVSLADSLPLAIGGCKNLAVHRAFSAGEQSLLAGLGMSAALSHHSVLPRLWVELVMVGEENNFLPQTLDNLANAYEKEVENRLGAILSLMEPMSTVSNQQKWDTLGAERSGAGWRSGELPEGPVVASSPFGGLSLHLLPAL